MDKLLMLPMLFIILQLNLDQVDALQCHNCFSEISWDDCNTRITIQNCKDENVCAKFHRIKKQQGKETHYFGKHCHEATECSQKKCELTNGHKRFWCEFNCCNTTLCNTGVTPFWQKYYSSAQSSTKATISGVAGVCAVAWAVISTYPQ